MFIFIFCSQVFLYSCLCNQRNVQSPASRVQRPESSIQSPASRVQRAEFSVQNPASRVQFPESRVQRADSRVQHPTLASRVQEFRYANRKSLNSSEKWYQELALRLRDRHVFMWQSMKVLNVFNTLTLIKIFWKTKTFFKKLEYCFLVEPLRLKTHHSHSKLLCQKPMLRQIEWRLQN